ncbi:hypothetical protein [Owenweeksia hongkongensis]|uniref:hypothetical protein n=1 Tax=Owenweeksia hongkongensis TaxID=253245 RepID=UPI003A8D149A
MLDNRILVNKGTLSLDTIFGYGSIPVHKVLSHPNGYFYVTGWTQPRGSNPIEIGIYVNKVDSAGNLVDSVALTNFNGYDIQTYYKEGCVLNSGDLLLPFRWDTTVASCLKVMIVNENLQLKKTITRYFKRSINVVSSVATNDGGAAILGEVQDTVDGVLIHIIST